MTSDFDFFEPPEFVTNNGTDWFPCMALKLLYKLDTYRCLTGEGFLVSKHDSALGRYLGPENESTHNVDYWGEVLAVDGFPANMDCREEANHRIQLARGCGFTGIGLYPDWHGGPGLHLDVRPTREPGDPATWGYVLEGNQYVEVTLHKALEQWRTR